MGTVPVRQRFGHALAIAGVVWVAGCRSKATTCTFVYEGDGPGGTVPVRAELVARGLEVPWGIAFITPYAMLVTERRGTLRLVDFGGVRDEPIATIPVHAEGESGLLGIALAPRFEETRRFFLYYTADKDGRAVNRIERWVLSADARSASPEKIIVDDIPASPAHDGGRIRIGPDGYLYAGTGDARDRDLPPSAESNAGKILRMTLDGAPPEDNPWPGRLAYVKGLRNVEAFDWFDTATGLPPSSPTSTTRIAIADHGPSGELGRRGNDRVMTSAAGADFGWPDQYGCFVGSGVTPTALAWSKAVPPGGASFYTGRSIPEWRGSFLVGTLGSRHLHRVVFDRADPREIVLHEVYFSGDPPLGLGRVRDVVMGPDGELYVTTSNCDGRGTCPPDGDKIFRVTR